MSCLSVALKSLISSIHHAPCSKQVNENILGINQQFQHSTFPSRKQQLPYFHACKKNKTKQGQKTKKKHHTENKKSIFSPLCCKNSFPPQPKCLSVLIKLALKLFRLNVHICREKAEKKFTKILTPPVKPNHNKSR